MFWHFVFSNNSAQIEKLLQKEDVTLEELMEEEELLQECQAQNKKLVDFLCQDQILRQLVLLVVTEPSSEVEYQLRFKHASVAAELLSAEVPAIVDKLAASEDLLSTLCKFLSNEKPLNPLLASFFSKVLGMLLHRRSEQNWYQYQVTCLRVVDFLKSCPDFIPRVTYHIGTSAIMNLLHKLMCGIEEVEMRYRIHEWVCDAQLVPLLIAKMGPENEWCEQANVEQLLCDVLDSGGGGGGMFGGGVAMGICPNGASGNSADNCSNPANVNMLLPLILNENTVQQLLQLLLHEHGTPSSITHVTNILIKMLSMHSCVLCAAMRPAEDGSTAAADAAAAACVAAAAAARVAQSNGVLDVGPGGETGPVCYPEFCVARAIADVMPQIHNMLLRPNENTVETSYGAVVERVGTTRLRLVALVTALIETRYFKIHEKMAHLHTVPHILDLFFRFPQNNFLHSLVQQCISVLLTQPSPCRTPPDAVLQQHRLATAKKISDAAAAAAAASAAARAAAAAAAAAAEAAGDAATDVEDAGSNSEVGGSDDKPADADVDGSYGDSQHWENQADVNCDQTIDGEHSSQHPMAPSGERDQEKMETSTSSNIDCDTIDRTLPVKQVIPESVTVVKEPLSDCNIPSNNSDHPPLLAESLCDNTSSSSPVQSSLTLGDTNFTSDIVCSDNKDGVAYGPISTVPPSSCLTVNSWDPATATITDPITSSAVDVNCGVVPDEESHPLLCQLMKEGRFVHRILLTYDYKLLGCDEVAPNGSLCGYRGHVRLLANALADNAKEGPNAALLNMLIQTLPSDVLELWQAFEVSTLPQANALNEISPVPGPEMTHMIDDSDDDDLHSDRNLLFHGMQATATYQNDNMLQIADDDLQLPKDMINAMTHSLSFDDNGFDATEGTSIGAATTFGGSSLSGGNDSSTNSNREDSDEQSRVGGGEAGGAGAAQSVQLFEKMCSDIFTSSNTSQDLDNMWSDKERHISFAPLSQRGNSEELYACHSSDEEEEDEDDDTRRRGSQLDASMEVDDMQDDWEAVFDRRNSDPSRDVGDTRDGSFVCNSDAKAAPTVPLMVPIPLAAPVPSASSPVTPTVSTPPVDFNPWQSAPSADTTGNDTSWASFGSAVFGEGEPSKQGSTSGIPRTDGAGDAFANVDFGPSFGGSNPFEAYRSPPTFGSNSNPTVVNSAAADQFAFKPELPDCLTQDLGSGGGASQAAAPSAACGDCSPISSMESPAATATEDTASPSLAATPPLSPPPTPDQQILETNFHFLSQLGALKGSSSPCTLAQAVSTAMATTTTTAYSSLGEKSPVAGSDSVTGAPCEMEVSRPRQTAVNAVDAAAAAEQMDIDVDPDRLVSLKEQNKTCAGEEALSSTIAVNEQPGHATSATEAIIASNI